MSASFSRGRVYFLLAVGVFACSTAVIWIRLSETAPILLAGWRLILSTLFLFPFAWKAWQTATAEQKRHSIWGTVLPGIFLAAHFISWSYGARMTEAARGTLIVNMAPVAMPFLLWLISREHVNRGEWLGTLIALGGVGLLTVPRLSPGSGATAGDWVCFGSMLMIAVYLALGRRYRNRGSLWLYLVPVYGWAGIICLGLALPFHLGEMIPPASQWIWLLALALIPTIVGHGFFNLALRHVGGQQVSVWSQGQFIFSAIIAFFVFGESPDLIFYPAALMIAMGAIITARSMPS